MLLTVGFVLAPIACSDGADPVAPEPAPTLVSIAVSTASAGPLTALGETVQLTAQGLNSAGATVAVNPTWSSSDPAVAEVDPSGLVKATGDGTATISATVAGVTGAAAVSVAQVATQLVIADQPNVAVDGLVFPTPLVVHVMDANGSLVANHPDPVTLSVVSSFSGPSVNGTLTAPAQRGVAVFDDLSPVLPGIDILLEAASGELTVLAESIAVVQLGTGFGLEQFAPIKAGTFQMGDQVGTGFTDELPVHSVNITREFHLQRTEVTQRQWAALMGDNPSVFPGCDLCPVERVS